MSKKSKAASRLRRLNEKRKCKAAMKALYASFSKKGENSKTKKSVKVLKEYPQGKRPRPYPPGTRPLAVRKSTKARRPEYTSFLMSKKAKKEAVRSLQNETQ